MLSNCFNRIEDNVAKSIFNNLVFVEFDWSDNYNKYVQVDYSKYRPVPGALPDLELTPEQQMLLYHLEKAKNDFIASNKVKQEKRSKGIWLFGYDISRIPPFYKLVFFIVAFGSIFLVLIYLLTKISGQKEPNKKKKKKE